MTNANQATKTPAAPPDFEGAMKELEGIVRKLESGNTALEAAIEDYARGMKLKEICEKKLADARLKVESIMASADGTVTTRPFDAPES